MSEKFAAQTACRRCLRMNNGDPWYCPHCGKETTVTPHDGGTYGDASKDFDPDTGHRHDCAHPGTCGCAAWLYVQLVLAQGAAAHARERVAQDFDRMSSHRNPTDPEGSRRWSEFWALAAERVRHPEHFAAVMPGEAKPGGFVVDGEWFPYAVGADVQEAP